MAVRRINDNHIGSSVQKGARALDDIRRRADRCRHQKTPVAILRRIRIFPHLFDIFNCDEPFEITVLIDERQFLDAMILEHPLRFGERRIFRRRDEAFLRHDFLDRLVQIRLETHIAIRDDPDQFPVHRDRHAGNVVFIHQIVRIGEKIVRSQRNRIDDDAVLRTLDLVDLFALLVDAHILVNDADAALTRNRNRHFRLRDRVHPRRHHRDIQLDFIRQHRRHVDFIRQHLRMCRNEQYVIKSQSLLSEFVFPHHKPPFFWKLRYAYF